MIPIQHYKTTDIFLGAYLLSSGGDPESPHVAYLSGISFNSRRRATFMFTGVGLQQLDREYRAGTALVNLVSLRDSLNHLRDVLFEMRDRRKRDAEKRTHEIRRSR